MRNSRNDLRSNLPLRQLAYFVQDVRAAAARHHHMFGSGPFFVADHIPTPVVRHRGQVAELDHSSAYGQWGSVMIEFVQQHNAGPSVFHDLYPEGSGREGLHHIALFVEDMAATAATFEREGHCCGLYAEMPSGFAFMMMDTSPRYGHMMELYEPTAELVGFYEMVRKASVDWSGEDALRTITLG